MWRHPELSLLGDLRSTLFTFHFFVSKGLTSNFSPSHHSSSQQGIYYGQNNDLIYSGPCKMQLESLQWPGGVDGERGGQQQKEKEERLRMGRDLPAVYHAAGF